MIIFLTTFVRRYDRYMCTRLFQERSLGGCTIDMAIVSKTGREGNTWGQNGSLSRGPEESTVSVKPRKPHALRRSQGQPTLKQWVTPSQRRPGPHQLRAKPPSKSFCRANGCDQRRPTYGTCAVRNSVVRTDRGEIKLHARYRVGPVRFFAGSIFVYA